MGISACSESCQSRSADSLAPRAPTLGSCRTQRDETNHHVYAHQVQDRVEPGDRRLSEPGARELSRPAASTRTISAPVHGERFRLPTDGSSSGSTARQTVFFHSRNREYVVPAKIQTEPDFSGTTVHRDREAYDEVVAPG